MTPSFPTEKLVEHDTKLNGVTRLADGRYVWGKTPGLPEVDTSLWAGGIVPKQEDYWGKCLSIMPNAGLLYLDCDVPTYRVVEYI